MNFFRPLAPPLIAAVTLLAACTGKDTSTENGGDTAPPVGNGIVAASSAPGARVPAGSEVRGSWVDDVQARLATSAYAPQAASDGTAEANNPAHG